MSENKVKWHSYPKEKPTEMDKEIEFYLATVKRGERIIVETLVLVMANFLFHLDMKLLLGLNYQSHIKENEYELKRQDGFANSCY